MNQILLNQRSQLLLPGDAAAEPPEPPAEPLADGPFDDETTDFTVRLFGTVDPVPSVSLITPTADPATVVVTLDSPLSTPGWT